jgi:hypothetical protein
MSPDSKPIRIIVGDDVKMKFYLEHYDVLMARRLDSSSPEKTLGTEEICRFCGGRPPAVTFNKIAHAVPELLGNKRLFARYECDACNNYFSAFEDDLAKSAAIFLFGAQIKGKSGVPTLRTRKKLSRAEFREHGYSFQEYDGDEILSIDEVSQTARLKLKHQRFRPLGVYKTLTKIALTVMPESELSVFKEALQWLKEPLSEGPMVTPSLCYRTFIPGPRPIPRPHVMLFRRKHGHVVPYSMLFLAVGNTSFQIVVPCPSQDPAGQTYSFPPIPMTASIDFDAAQGPPLHFTDDLSSADLTDAPSDMTFHFERIETKPMGGESGAAG